MNFKLLISLILILSFAIGAFSQAENLKYSEMTEAQKSKFIEDKSNEFLNNFRRTENDQISADGVKEVRKFIESYIGKKAKTNSKQCSFGDDVATILQRGKQSARSINHSFAKNNLPPQIGLYVAMIESEFCQCLQAPTGPLGMFQLAYYTSETFGLKAVKGASPSRPDERCEVRPAANAAALYFNKMLGIDFGNNSFAIPFAISAYNSGEGMTKKLLKGTEGKNLDNQNYWTIRSYYLKLSPDSEDGASRQFLDENHKYYPKFLAAMIIGENPKSFGIEMTPLSQMR